MAIQLAPELTLPYFGRAMVYSEKGESDKVIADLTEVIRLNPKDAEAYFVRGLTYKAMGESDKAEKDFYRAKKLGHKAS